MHHRRTAILLGLATPVLLALAGLLHAPDVAVGVASRLSPGVVYSAAIDEPVVALTIDDGPSPATDAILRALSENAARATFFVIGDHVERHPATVGRIRDGGNELAHHMMADRPSIGLDRSDFVESFGRMDGLLQELGGVRWFRPGSGWFGPTMIEDVEREGYRLVLGSVYPFDAQIQATDFIAGYVLENVRPGSIIILHDGAARGVRTAAALGRVLPELRRRGFRVVTVTELLGLEAAGRLDAQTVSSPVTD